MPACARPVEDAALRFGTAAGDRGAGAATARV